MPLQTFDVLDADEAALGKMAAAATSEVDTSAAIASLGPPRFLGWITLDTTTPNSS